MLKISYLISRQTQFLFTNHVGKVGYLKFIQAQSTLIMSICLLNYLSHMAHLLDAL